MKNIILLFLISGALLNAQTVTRVKDPYITAQEKRQVFQKWGEWKPEPQYFLFVQTNLHYTNVWGALAPKENRQYRRGEDIRPLKADGLQWQRYGEITLHNDESTVVERKAEDWYNTEKNEFLNVTNLEHAVDPLFIVYYQPKLKKLQDFPVNSLYYRDWGFTKPQAFDNAVKFGMISEYKRLIEEIQDKYKVAKGVNVSRGKRLIMYHEVFMEWRKMQASLKNLEAAHHIRDISLKDKVKWAQVMDNTGRSDWQIFRDVLKNSKTNIE